MIRPEPTSISISPSDITTHLQHIDIYHGLLKQGFKKKDIHRYFREQRETTIKNGQFSGERSTIQQKTCAQDSSSYQDVSTARAKEDGFNVAATRTPLAISPNIGTSPVPSPAIPKQAIISTGTASRHHAPRQSSLLRYASNLSTDSLDEPFVNIKFSPRSQITYRPRSVTYPYEQSELDDEDGSTCSSLITVFEDFAIDESLVPPTLAVLSTSSLRGDAKEFTPLGVPSKVSSSPTNSDTVSPTYLSSEETVQQYSPAVTSRIIPALSSTVSRYVSQPPEHLPRSPTVYESGFGKAKQPGYTLPHSHNIPQIPRRSHIAGTEPRDHRFRYLDGPSFTPYNDSLPNDSQPQTPADLARRPMIDELTAAYTAPPGRLRHDVSSPRLGYTSEVEQGQESPTNRAVNVRRRRHREYARSARIEGLIISRTRGRQQSVGDDEYALRPSVNDIWDEHFEWWRDDLDADRVGEENFDDTDGFAGPTVGGMRVVSGNQRTRGV